MRGCCSVLTLHLLSHAGCLSAAICLPAVLGCCASAESENELMDMAIQALEHSRALTSMEAMVMAAGAYGAGDMAGAYGGSAGGILDSEPQPTTTPAQTGLEAGNSNAPAATKPSTPAPAPAASTTAKSAALPAHQSAGLLAAGLLAAVFLL